MGGMGGLFSDPELLESLSDPEVAAAFEDITSNPANIMKYQGNPKVMKLLTKMATVVRFKPLAKTIATTQTSCPCKLYHFKPATGDPDPTDPGFHLEIEERPKGKARWRKTRACALDILHG